MTHDEKLRILSMLAPGTSERDAQNIWVAMGMSTLAGLTARQTALLATALRDAVQRYGLKVTP